MRAQIALEYIFAFLMWIIICTITVFMINPYVSALSSGFTTMSYSATIQKLNEIAASDLDGMKHTQVYHKINNTLSFNNTIVAIHTTDGEVIIGSQLTYTYADNFNQGDRMLIKNNGDDILVIRVE
ncbi:MAG: hypothetical protein ABIG39_06370 [Candidatus Micrarchaeota archaeon]